MNGADAHPDGHALVAEIIRYLAAVEAFRESGCGPTWRSELRPPAGGALHLPPALRPAATP